MKTYQLIKKIQTCFLYYYLLANAIILWFLYWNAVNDGMSRRAVHKAIFESAALIGASALQVYLLRRLFERKLGTSRV